MLANRCPSDFPCGKFPVQGGVQIAQPDWDGYGVLLAPADFFADP